MSGGQKGLTGRHGRMGGNFGFLGSFTGDFDGVTKFVAGTAVIVEAEEAIIDNDTAGTAVEEVDVDINGAAIVDKVATEAAKEDAYEVEESVA